ncbi:MAG: imidazoleglycerol-phosphate dehydratase HisB [Lachnospiraceae bacterium]|jgi:imidazoleglycerol-phosphate dehydratase|nr:imidazoleglycerol-phosphate dehydratase HisB [Lachnospiraceae bacterium]MCI1657807.1 imidazoleglycerol-phosphate dehydratase HisB [Lachnospiraceae bacterium]MCI2196280.1 imidazoleglycerol-phosphate dehydratase HisB [Lachnospiraceae bacterium]
MNQRTATVSRKTGETDITITINLDGSGKTDIHTGIGFFDHMLNSFARHGFFDLQVTARGDLEVDCHHTIEDTAIVLGEAIRQAAGTKEGICRFGSMILPMDEALVLSAVDLSGRAFLVFDYDFRVPSVGGFDTEMVHEFFYALSSHVGMNLHIKVLEGKNAHHIIEAIFKATARALDAALAGDGRIDGILSTKGSL